MSNITVNVTENKVNITKGSDEVTRITVTNPEPVRVITAYTQGPAGRDGIDGQPGAAGARVYAETLIGVIDGNNNIFSLTHPYLQILDIQLNGLGGELFSSLDSDTIVLTEAPVLGDSLKVIYTY